jgi:hypothetical protein
VSFLKKVFGARSAAASPILSPEDEAKLKNGLERLRFCIKHVNTDMTLYEVGHIIEALKPLGESASSAVAGFLHELVAKRDAGIRFILAAAEELPATPDLIDEIRKVAMGKSVYQGEPSPSERKMMQNNLVLWTTATNVVIRKYAEDYLAKLSGK